MYLLLSILVQLCFVSFLIILFYRLKPKFGLAPLYILLGTNQYFQTILASSFYINFFGELSISPGSIILFSSSLFVILFIYIKEGVRSTQILILGIVLANLSVTILAYITNLQEIVMQDMIHFSGTAPDFFKTDFRIFFVGTITLVIDAFLMVILYQFLLSKVSWLNLFARLFITLLIVLNFDAVVFALGSFGESPDLWNKMASQLFAKSVAALFFSTVLFLYLRYLDTGIKSNKLNEKTDKEGIFSILTYKGKFEKLVSEKAISEEELNKIIAEKTSEQEKALRRFNILSSAKELRIDQFSVSEQAKEFLFKIRDAFEVDACTIHLVKGEELQMLSSVGIEANNKDYFLKFNLDYLNKMTSDKPIYFLEDTNTKAGFFDGMSNIDTDFKFISHAGIVLTSGGKKMGLLKLFSVHNKRIFSPLELEHLQLVANQIAHAIESSQLFEQNEKHKEVLVKQMIARKNAEQAIIEKATQLQTLSDNLPGSVMYQVLRKEDGTMTFTYLSKNVVQFTGKTPEEVIQNPGLLYGIIHEEDGPLIAAAADVSFRDMSVFNVEVRSKNLVGAQKWVHIRSIPRRQQDGTVIWDGIMTDITERKRAEEEISKAIERFELIGKAANDAVWEWDLETNAFWGNEIHMNMYGLTRADSEPGDDEWKRRLHTEDRERMIKLIDDTLASDINSFDAEYRLYTENKGWINIYNRTYIERNEAGKAIRMLGSMMDITERKKTDQAIKESEEKFRTLVQQAADGIFIVDVDGNYLEANESLAKLTGYSIEELKKMNGRQIVEPKSLRQQPLKLEEIKTGRPVFVERVIVKKDGTLRNVEISAQLMDNGKVIAIMRDITDRKKAEESIKETNEKLGLLAAHLQTVREEERKRIAREIHDELGQQLTAIKMDVAWIDKNTADSASGIKNKIKNTIALLDGSNQSIRRLLNELRHSVVDDFGLIEALEWQNLQFEENSGIPIVLSTNEKDFIFDSKIANCIFRLFQESMTNIIRYAQAKKVLTSINILNDEIIVTIEDDGVGFDAAVASSKTGSFGLLGMKERVRSLNGKFELITAKGKGTKIVVNLPCKHI